MDTDLFFTLADLLRHFAIARVADFAENNLAKTLSRKYIFQLPPALAGG